MNTTKQISRDILICIKNGCDRCDPTNKIAPMDCEWAMKHLLSTNAGIGVMDRPRRWGKTTQVMKAAVALHNQGHNVVIFYPTQEMLRMHQRPLMGTGVEMASVGGWDRARLGNHGGYQAVHRTLISKPERLVLSDEVHPWIEECVNDMNQHTFILGFYSSP